jgi:hypothetical protein
VTGQFYEADADDPLAPILLTEYRGLRPGDHVVYDNPQSAAGLDGPLVISEIWQFAGIGPHFPEFTSAVLNGGEYECNADNLRTAPKTERE